jgi:ergothioneine biosynthesis protein EgtB
MHAVSLREHPPATLRDRYASVRARTLALTAPLSAEDCAVQSMPDASPVKWHLAHTTWFFETFVLLPHVAGYTAFREAFRMLFNSYYVGVGERHPRPERGLLTRPTLEEVRAYRGYVDGAMEALLDAGHAGEVAALVELGLQHEQQHQELIVTDVKHLLSRNPLAPVYRAKWKLMPVSPKPRGWIAHPGGVIEAGHVGMGFAFDNERPRHRTLLAPHAIATHPVTNREFRAFVEDDGYRRPALWCSLGWDEVVAQGWDAPLYWRRRDGGWHVFTLHGEVPLDEDTPVSHVSWFEADAFARWSGARLPTEFEWEALAEGRPVEGHFADAGWLHPLPAGSSTPGAPAQLFSDVWEWTASSYAAYPGFRPAEGALGEYNGKFMCNQYVLRGGSCATPQDHVRPSYRNFFPPGARWQFAGLRLARDA